MMRNWVGIQIQNVCLEPVRMRGINWSADWWRVPNSITNPLIVQDLPLTAKLTRANTYIHTLTALCPVHRERSHTLFLDTYIGTYCLL